MIKKLQIASVLFVVGSIILTTFLIVGDIHFIAMYSKSLAVIENYVYLFTCLLFIGMGVSFFNHLDYYKTLPQQFKRATRLNSLLKEENDTFKTDLKAKNSKIKGLDNHVSELKLEQNKLLKYLKQIDDLEGKNESLIGGGNRNKLQVENLQFVITELKTRKKKEIKYIKRISDLKERNDFLENLLLIKKGKNSSFNQFVNDLKDDV